MVAARAATPPLFSVPWVPALPLSGDLELVPRQGIHHPWEARMGGPVCDTGPGADTQSPATVTSPGQGLYKAGDAKTSWAELPCKRTRLLPWLLTWLLFLTISWFLTTSHLLPPAVKGESACLSEQITGHDCVSTIR